MIVKAMLKKPVLCLLLPLFGLLTIFPSCTRQSQIARNEENTDKEVKPLLALSVLPHTWFAARLAGERVRTLVLVGPGQNPHSYEPAPRQMRELAQAGAWVLSGAEFEIGLLPKIQSVFPGLKIIDGTDGVVFRSLEEHDEDHDDDGIDRHTWLGQTPAKILASHIRDALVLIDPAGEEQYNENYSALIDEIDAEFASLRIDLALLRGSAVFVYHPSFGYFLDEFGIRQEAVESGGKEPGPRELSLLIDRAKQQQAQAIFVQAQFPVNAAKTLADVAGAKLISLDPLSPDWLGNIRLMGNVLKSAAMAAEPSFRADETKN
jgi:zinc transport system substrate-binding protein